MESTQTVIIYLLVESAVKPGQDKNSLGHVATQEASISQDMFEILRICSSMMQ